MTSVPIQVTVTRTGPNRYKLRMPIFDSVCSLHTDVGELETGSLAVHVFTKLRRALDTAFGAGVRCFKEIVGIVQEDKSLGSTQACVC